MSSLNVEIELSGLSRSVVEQNLERLESGFAGGSLAGNMALQGCSDDGLFSQKLLVIVSELAIELLQPLELASQLLPLLLTHLELIEHGDDTCFESKVVGRITNHSRDRTETRIALAGLPESQKRVLLGGWSAGDHRRVS